mgnify:CR=1 FL=1
MEEQNRKNDVHMSNVMLTWAACSLGGAENHQLKRSGSEACTKDNRVLGEVCKHELVCIRELDCKVHVHIAMQLIMKNGQMERPGPVFSSELVRVNKKSVKVCTDGDPHTPSKEPDQGREPATKVVEHNLVHEVVEGKSRKGSMPVLIQQYRGSRMSGDSNLTTSQRCQCQLQML